MPTPEALARAKIDELLTAADWIIQDDKAMNLDAVREIPLNSGRHNYVAKRARATARQAGISGDLAWWMNWPPCKPTSIASPAFANLYGNRHFRETLRDATAKIHHPASGTYEVA